MKILIIGVILCGVGLILSIGGIIELIKVKSLKNKKVFRVYYRGSGEYATIVCADSPTDVVRRFYDERSHYYDIIKIEPVEEFE